MISELRSRIRLTEALRVFERWFVLAVLAASLSLNVYLGLHQRPRHASGSAPVSVGEKVPTLSVASLSGEKLDLTWVSDRRPTILYVFKPSCVWCKRNLKNVEALSVARASDYRFIGLSLSTANLSEYVAKNQIPFPVYSYVSANAGGHFGVGGTPTTLMISPDGTIKELWQGAYAGNTQTQVETRMHVKLPGVTM
jgi:peroxiredoxin